MTRPAALPGFTRGWHSMGRPPGEGAITEVALSADGTTVAVTLTAPDLAADIDRNSTWMRPTAPGGAWSQVPVPPGFTSLTFAPSPGLITGTIPGAAGGRVVVVCEPSGAHRVITPPMLPGGKPAWREDGRVLAWSCAEPPTGTPVVRRATRHRFDLDGRGWLTEAIRQPHVWRDDGRADGVAGTTADCQDLTFADDESLLYVAAPQESPRRDFGAQVFRWDRRTDRQTALTEPTLVPACPVPLPGGAFAMIALTGPEGAGRAGAVYLGAADSRPELLTDPSACDIAHPLTSRMSRLFSIGEFLLAAELARGATPLLIMNPSRPGWIRRLLAGPLEVHAVDVSAGGVAAVVRSGLSEEDLVYLSADELACLDQDGSDLPAHTAMEPARWRSASRPDRATAGVPEPLPVHAADGEVIDAWFVTPSAPGPVPLVVWLHGGPGAQAGWSVPPDVQRLVRQGFACLYVNPRGSAGRGEGFSRQLLGRLGDIDAEDVRRAVLAAVGRPEVDDSRVGIHGLSYGGYLAGLLWSRWPLFKAAVVERAITSWTAHRWGSDLGLAVTSGYWPDGPGRGQPDPLTEPVRNRSPVLILTAEHDLRCPPAESRMLFGRLLDHDVPAELVVLSGAGHNLAAARPQVRQARADTLTNWWARRFGQPL